MSKIVKLSDHLANMIAAGEVVERPSSVVKELVENSIDAHATHITINLKESGIKLIEVIDDGVGMSREDAEMCFERHATSKIKNQYDLFRIGTLGFRGEAIPSIASVSKFNLYTSDGVDSTNVEYNAGKKVKVEPCAMNQGTRISVANLFYNVPARLKYLKSLKSELGSITYLVSKFIIANPQISFKLTNDDKVIYNSSGTNDLISVFGHLYGVNVAKNLVSDEFKEEGYKVYLLAAKNMISRSNKLEITLIVNNRFVKSNVITDAVVAAYKTLIPEGRYPIALIKIDIDPLLIDVNVHPSKMQIKIAQENTIASLITEHLRKQLIVDNLIPDAVEQDGYKKATLLDEYNEAKSYDEIEAGYKVEKKTEEPTSYIDEAKKIVEDSTQDKELVLHEEEQVFSLKNLNSFKKQEETVKVVDSNLETIPLSMRYSERRIPELNYIGQIHGTYLIFEALDGMYIMDQHAAAERINYEYYYNILANPTADRQTLIVPIKVELTKTEGARVVDLLDEFKGLGFILKVESDELVSILEMPTWVKFDDAADFVHALISDYKNNFNLNVMSYRDNISKQIACKASIKANHKITLDEVNALVKRLRNCNNPFTCPHGRPTIIRYSKTDLEKMFMRIM